MMSLRGIHLVFITASIALAVMVTLWGVAMYVSDRGTWGTLGVCRRFAGIGRWHGRLSGCVHS